LHDSGTSNNYDEIALIGHYRSLIGDNTKAADLAKFLYSKWNRDLGVLGMDQGDSKARLFRVYKTALAGTLFARARMTDACASATNKLEALQELEGGWKTDLDSTGQKNGTANVETTCLALICLDCTERGRFSPIIT